MNGVLKLKKSVTSVKFGITFPPNVELKCWVDNYGNLYAYHPTAKNICVHIKENNTYGFKEVEPKTQTNE